MNILVTGANGYIGSNVIDYLVDNLDANVFATDLFIDHINDKSHKLQLDLFDKSVLDSSNFYEMLGSPDVVIHLAWKDGFKHNSLSHIENLYSHYLFITKLLATGNVKSISVMGSMHEVGYHEGIINSNTACNPCSLYGIAKNALRQMLLNAVTNSETKLKWLRAYYIYGDSYRGSSIFSKIVNAAKEGKKTFPMNDGNNMYDFISVFDLAKQISLASIQNKYNGIINVCSGKPVRLRDQVEAFITQNNLDIELQYGVFPKRAYDSPIEFGDATIINKIIEDFESDSSEN